jgi:pyrophosphatase PpaX
MSPSPRRAVLFDLDGTLVDTIDLLLESVRHAFEGRAGAPSTTDWIAGIGTPLADQLRPYASDEADLQSLTDRYRRYQRAHHDRGTYCYDDVVSTVRRLSERGHPMAIVTSKANDIALRTVTHVGLAPYFPVIVGVESTTRHKPDPEPVRVALEALGARAPDAVFVGDSPHDVRSGNAAGVTTIGALWGPFSRAQLESVHPAHVLERIAGLPALLDSLPVPAAA